VTAAAQTTSSTVKDRNGNGGTRFIVAVVSTIVASITILGGLMGLVFLPIIHERSRIIAREEIQVHSIHPHAGSMRQDQWQMILQRLDLLDAKLDSVRQDVSGISVRVGRLEEALKRP
jgi:hypothetical protein